MSSKEEIKQAKTFMVFYKNYCLNKEISNMKNYKTVNDEEFIYKNIERILQYIDQLETKIKKSETDKQKLIEKLEEQANRKIPLAEDGDYVQGHRDLARDLLEILEVENEQ